MKTLYPSTLFCLFLYRIFDAFATGKPSGVLTSNELILFWRALFLYDLTRVFVLQTAIVFDSFFVTN